MAIMSKLQSAYLAGLIDGEGYIGLLKVKKGNKANWRSVRDCVFLAVLKVAMTDRRTIEWLYDSFGGTFEIRKAHDNAKESYCWSLRGKKMVDFIKYPYPFLKIKKREVDMVFEFHKMNAGPGFKTPDSVHAKRLELYTTLRGLHSRGAPVETK